MNKLQAHHKVSNLLNETILKIRFELVRLPILTVMFKVIIIGCLIHFLHSFQVGVIACQFFDIPPLPYLLYAAFYHIETHESPKEYDHEEAVD